LAYDIGIVRTLTLTMDFLGRLLEPVAFTLTIAMDYLPLFADLAGRPCLVAGGGAVAHRKVALLQEAGADITVVAPQIDAGLREQDGLKFIEREFTDSDVDDKLLVIAATSDKQVNHHIAELCKQQNTLCNVVDDKQASGFIMPAIVDRSPVQIAVSSGGTSPVLATRIRALLETALPQKLGSLADWAARWRETTKQHFNDSDQLRHFWRDVLDGPVADQVLKGDENTANQMMTRLLAEDSSSEKQNLAGEAYIVGAGCGDPELLTLKAAQLLQQADIVLHDRLVSKDILALARRDADKISVGKLPGGRGKNNGDSQQEINALLVELVKNGKRVCRLKGGDPTIFGRGGEEVLALSEAGLQWQIVPGITAAAGAASYAGIPLTHRGIARSVVFVTARDRNDQPPPDWQALASDEQTIVLYMGVGAAKDIEDGLLAAGKAADTPVAVVANATTPQQQVATGRLDSLSKLIAQENIKAPAVIIVGEVVSLAEHMQWFVTTDNGSDEPWSPAAFSKSGKEARS